MKDNWVDFRAVKEAASMQAVLGHYNINWLRKSGNELRGHCPIHDRDKTGSESFQANLAKDAFQCFSCRAKGNILDFVAAMEKCNIRDAALKVKSWFEVPGTPEGRAGGQAAGWHEEEEKLQDDVVGENNPLDFELKGIDTAHPYLAERGITKKTAETFGTGFFPGKGSMSGRIVIPIHNERWDLVAYAGRSVDGSEPKYKLPPGFHKGRVLFNFHRAVGQDDYLVILVEGFFGTMVLHQAGFPATVALMGCQLSAVQEQLLVSQFEEVVVLLDGDEAGRNASRAIAARLVSQMFVRVVDLDDGEQPDRMSPEALQQLLLNDIL